MLSSTRHHSTAPCRGVQKQTSPAVVLSNHAAFSQLTMKEARAFAATRLRATTPISLQDMTSVCCHPQQLSQSNEGPVHTAVRIAATAAAG